MFFFGVQKSLLGYKRPKGFFWETPTFFFWDTKGFFGIQKMLLTFSEVKGSHHFQIVLDILEGQKRQGWGSAVGGPKAAEKKKQRRKHPQKQHQQQKQQKQQQKQQASRNRSSTNNSKNSSRDSSKETRRRGARGPRRCKEYTTYYIKLATKTVSIQQEELQEH